MDSTTSLHSRYAWSKRVQRAYCSVPRNRGKNTTLLASMSVEGMGPSMAIVDAVDAQAFEAYLEQVLLSYLRPGQEAQAPPPNQGTLLVPQSGKYSSSSPLS
jgi:hypothetical protein